MTAPHRHKLAQWADYEPVASAPDDLRWKPMGGSSPKYTVLSSIGGEYRLKRERDTGAVEYFKLRSTPEKSSAEKIDSEPDLRARKTKFRVGNLAWFVVDGRWFLVRIVAVTSKPEHLTIKSETGHDADKQTPWPYGELLEFPRTRNSVLYRHLFRLAARYV